MDKQAVAWMDVSRKGTDATGMFPNAIRVGNQVFFSGQTLFDLSGNLLDIHDAGAQAGNALANIKSLLEEMGGQLSDVVKITVFVTDRAHRRAVYAEIANAFGGKCPCSTGVVVDGFGRSEVLVEIDATAILPDGSSPDAQA